MARLTGEQVGRLRAAILDAFDRDDLEQMLWIRLNQRLSDFASASSFKTTVYQVITVAEKEGWTPDLLNAIGAERPRLADLQALVAELLAWVERDQPVRRSAPSDQIYERLGRAQWDGMMRLRQGDPDALAGIEKNLSDVDEAVRTFPRDARFHALKGYMLKDVYQSPTSAHLLTAEQRRGYLAEARKSAEQALKLDPDAAGNHNLMGNVLFLEGEYAAAVAQYDLALQLNHDDAYAAVIQNDRNLAVQAQDRLTRAGR